MALKASEANAKAGPDDLPGEDRLLFARMPNEGLRETIDNLARLFLIAGWIERTEAPDAD